MTLHDQIIERVYRDARRIGMTHDQAISLLSIVQKPVDYKVIEINDTEFVVYELPLDKK